MEKLLMGGISQRSRGISCIVMWHPSPFAMICRNWQYFPTHRESCSSIISIWAMARPSYNKLKKPFGNSSSRRSRRKTILYLGVKGFLFQRHTRWHQTKWKTSGPHLLDQQHVLCWLCNRRHWTPMLGTSDPLRFNVKPVPHGRVGSGPDC